MLTQKKKNKFDNTYGIRMTIVQRRATVIPQITGMTPTVAFWHLLFYYIIFTVCTYRLQKLNCCVFTINFTFYLTPKRHVLLHHMYVWQVVETIQIAWTTCSLKRTAWNGYRANWAWRRLEAVFSSCLSQGLGLTVFKIQLNNVDGNLITNQFV